MDQQTLLSLVDDLNTLPLETRWLLRGIQLGLKLSDEVETSRVAELARAGLLAKNPGGPSNVIDFNSGNDLR